MTKTLSTTELKLCFFEKVREAIDHWHKLTDEEVKDLHLDAHIGAVDLLEARLQGVVHSVFAVLDGYSDKLDMFLIVPLRQSVPHLDSLPSDLHGWIEGDPIELHEEFGDIWAPDEEEG